MPPSNETPVLNLSVHTCTSCVLVRFSAALNALALASTVFCSLARCFFRMSWCHRALACAFWPRSTSTCHVTVETCGPCLMSQE